MTEIPEDALRLSWDDVYQQSIQLAQQIETFCQQNGEQFDVLLIVPRGGYYVGNIVSRELGFESVDIIHASVGSYSVDSTDQSDFRLGQMPPKELVEGRRVLVIDEVCDTGKTLLFLKNYLQEIGAADVKIGVLHYKPGMSRTGYVPDWYGSETDKWIVYPWETREMEGNTLAARRKT